jgi:uncharacterized phage protein gp47/JayE
MPYSRPYLTDLQNQVLQDINAAEITDSTGNVLQGLLSQAILRVIANATAGMSYGHYGYVDWISLQAVPWTATDEFLEGWASLKDVSREAATPAFGTVTFTGAAGTDVPAGTQIVRQDNVTFVTTGDQAVSGTAVTVTIEANVPAAAGNFAPNTIFYLASPIEGIQAQSTASVQTIPGTDQELDPALRTRMLLAYAAPPQGGSRTDYIEWATDVPGVTRAWVAPNGMGAGTVVVYFMMDLAEAAFGGFPQGTNGVATNDPRATVATGDQLTVANAILPEQPVTALVYLCAPIAEPVAFTVADLGANNTPAMQALIVQALSGMFLQLGQAGGTINPATGAPWPGIEPNDWYTALEAIPGLTSFKVPVPAGVITPSTGSLLTAGAMTFAA